MECFKETNQYFCSEKGLYGFLIVVYFGDWKIELKQQMYKYLEGGRGRRISERKTSENSFYSWYSFL